jgi:tricorn protease
VEVVDLPEARIAGGDPSLEKAVQLLLQELQKQPPPAARPTPPVMAR